MIVTSGPTHEPIDPVRYIANRSSGKQGHAIAEAAASAGANVTLVAGPVNIPDPKGVNVVRVESARDMLAAVEKRAAGRHRGVCRRGRRLAHRKQQPGKRSRRPARARPSSNSSRTRTSSQPSRIANPGGRGW